MTVFSIRRVRLIGERARRKARIASIRRGFRRCRSGWCADRRGTSLERRDVVRDKRLLVSRERRLRPRRRPRECRSPRLPPFAPDGRARDAGLLEAARDPQGDVLAPRRGDDLHADGSPSSSGTGTATTGRPTNEIGWVKTPRFGRSGSSTRRGRRSAGRSSAPGKASPARGSRRRSRTAQHPLAIPAAEFWARFTQAAGIMAPAISRSRTAGSKSCGRCGCGRDGGPPLPRGDDVGGGAGARRFRDLDAALGAERLRRPLDRREGVRCRRCGNGRLRRRSAGPRCRGRARQSARAAPRRGRIVGSRGPASRRRRARGRRRCAPAARDGRGSRRRESCRPASAARRSASGRTRRRATAGTRIEPLVSEPSASGTKPAATAAPEPPEEPPVMRPSSCGLREGPSWTFSPVKS